MEGGAQEDQGVVGFLVGLEHRLVCLTLVSSLSEHQAFINIDIPRPPGSLDFGAPHPQGGLAESALSPRRPVEVARSRDIGPMHGKWGGGGRMWHSTAWRGKFWS